MQDNIQLLGSNDLSKTSIKTISEKILQVFENGEKTALELDLELKFAEEIIKKTREELNTWVLKSTVSSDLEINGCKIAYKSGYAQLNYEQDSEYLELKTKLAERKKLLDLAYKSGQNIVTDEGEIIPKVRVKNYTKDSITYTFKK